MNEYKQRVAGFERESHRRWELARWEVWQLMAPHYKKGQAPRTPSAFCRFPWDAGTISTEEEARQMYERSRVTENEARILNEFFTKLNSEK